MTTSGEKLLDLTIEYKAAKASREDEWPSVPGQPVGREPSIIAAEYETALKELLSR